MAARTVNPRRSGPRMHTEYAIRHVPRGDARTRQPANCSKQRETGVDRADPLSAGLFLERNTGHAERFNAGMLRLFSTENSKIFSLLNRTMRPFSQLLRVDRALKHWTFQYSIFSSSTKYQMNQLYL